MSVVGLATKQTDASTLMSYSWKILTYNLHTEGIEAAIVDGFLGASAPRRFKRVFQD
jgi:hypothetical protein